jgi:hypothetical protein
MDSMQEVVGLLYVALATAAGGRDLLDEANDILLEAVNRGTISRPDTKQTIMSLIATTSRMA